VEVQAEENLGAEALALLATSQDLDLSRRDFDWLVIVTFDGGFVSEEAWQLPYDAVRDLAHWSEARNAHRLSVTRELREHPRAELLQDARGAPAAKLRPGVCWQRNGCAADDPDVTDLYESLRQSGTVRLPLDEREKLGNALKRRAAEDGFFANCEIGTVKLVGPLQAECVADPKPRLTMEAEKLYGQIKRDDEVWTSGLWGGYHLFADLHTGAWLQAALETLAEADGMELEIERVDDVGHFLGTRARPSTR
jgi:hypothetical protein